MKDMGFLMSNGEVDTGALDLFLRDSTIGDTMREHNAVKDCIAGADSFNYDRVIGLEMEGEAASDRFAFTDLSGKEKAALTRALRTFVVGKCLRTRFGFFCALSFGDIKG